VRVDVVGEAGHASMPTIGDNPVPRLAEVLARIGLGRPDPRHVDPTLRATLDALLGAGAVDVLGLPAALAQASRLHPVLPHLLSALAGTTMAPTLLHGSAAANVIPARAGVGLDCRTLPGTTDEQVLADVRGRLADLPAVELSQPVPSVAGNASPAAGPLWEACADFLARELGARPLPLLCTGFTDSVHLRRDFGTVAYGFSPFRATPTAVIESGYHNRDERVHVDDLALSVTFHREVAHRLLG
jgi:acetylornithine deacetylase/succinyl-diaminopimelate desuccinylase-like protein